MACVYVALFPVIIILYYIIIINNNHDLKKIYAEFYSRSMESFIISIKYDLISISDKIKGTK